MFLVNLLFTSFSPSTIFFPSNLLRAHCQIVHFMFMLVQCMPNRFLVNYFSSMPKWPYDHGVFFVNLLHGFFSFRIPSWCSLSWKSPNTTRTNKNKNFLLYFHAAYINVLNIHHINQISESHGTKTKLLAPPKNTTTTQLQRNLPTKFGRTNVVFLFA